MANILADVEARIGALKANGAQLPVRIRLTTEDAVAFAKALEQKVLQNAEHVLAHAKAFEHLAAKDIAEINNRGRAALAEHVKALEAAEHKFWEAFHGQPHGDAEIVRAPAPKLSEPTPPADAAQEVKP